MDDVLLEEDAEALINTHKFDWIQVGGDDVYIHNELKNVKNILKNDHLKPYFRLYCDALLRNLLLQKNNFFHFHIYTGIYHRRCANWCGGG